MLAMMACIFASCSDGGSDEPANPTPKPEEVKAEITIDNSIVTNGLSFSVAQGEQSVSFTTNTNWTLSIAATTGGSTWCKASATSGSKGTANVKFTVTENTDYDDRSVSVTIKAGTASKTFTITQKGADALLVTTKKYEVAQAGGKIEVEVKANIEYQIAVSETAKDWIKETQSKSRALTAKKHTFEIAENEEAEKREGEITVKSGDKVETVKVYQAGGAVLLLSKNEFTVSDTGETISVDIKSNVEYGVQMPDVDWIQDEASNRGMSSHTLKYVISPNEGYDSRSAEIIFYDHNSDLKDTLKVVQAQKDAIVISKKEYEVEAEGETIEVKLSANVDFEVTMPEVDWIEQVESRALTEHTLYFKVMKNEDEESRSAEVIFTNKDSNIDEKIILTQQGNIPQAEFTINVTEPGTLKSYIEADRVATLTSIKITGDLNGDDFNIIRRMRSLKVLDLVEARIVTGGINLKSIEGILSKMNDSSIEEIIPSSVKYFYAPNNLIEIRGYINKTNYYTSYNSPFATIGYTNVYKEGSDLQYVKLPNSLQRIMDVSFAGTSLSKIIIPENVDSIGDYAFYKSGLDVFISNSPNLNYIGSNAFTKCSLTEIDLSKGVELIEKNAFENAFYDNSSVNIKLPVNLKKIGASAFSTTENYRTPSIMNMYLSDINSWVNVELEDYRSTPFYMGREENNLYYKDKLTDSLTITGVNKINDYVFYGCTSLKKVVIGDKVDIIGKSAFESCENIIELNIGNEVAIISNRAFYSCDKLDKIILGKGLEKVEDMAFYYTSPKEVYCNATTPPSIVASSNFNKIDKKTAKLYVPKGTYSAYYLSNWGSCFTNIIEME